MNQKSFSQISRLQNESGIIFVTVLMIILLMSIATASVISLNTTQSLTGEGEARRIQAEALAHGAVAYAYMNQLSASPSNSITYSETISGRTFNVVITKSNVNDGPSATYPLTVSVSY